MVAWRDFAIPVTIPVIARRVVGPDTDRSAPVLMAIAASYTLVVSIALNIEPRNHRLPRLRLDEVARVIDAETIARLVLLPVLARR
jgi:hypothetical protein